MTEQALTAAERELVHLSFMQGPAALIEADYNGEQARAFLTRPEVSDEFEMLVREFGHQDTLFALSEFGLKRQLTRLAPNAVAVLGRALSGPVYSRDDDGNILMDSKGRLLMTNPGPDGNQIHAATEILNRIGVDGNSKKDGKSALNVSVLFESGQGAKVKIVTDTSLKTTEEQALSRERMRTAISKLSGVLPDAKARVLKKLGLSDGKKPVKKKKIKKSPAE